MAWEYAGEIRCRYHRGKRNWATFQRNNTCALMAELHVTSATIRKVRKHKPCSLPDEIQAMIRRRLALAFRAYRRWKPDSIKALKAEYRMSTDTLMNIIDAAGDDLMEVTRNFLTGRLG
jgi:hypothetical protein